MRHPRRSGTAGLAAAILLLCLLALPASIAAGPIEDLQGSWATAASAAPALKWSGDAGGFTVAWTPEGGTATTVQFTPAGRPNVYGGSAKEGWSIMDSMFGDNHPVNPLEGGALYWARSAQDGVYLYRMEIEDNGSFAIDRYALRLADGALTVALDRRTAERGGQIREQRLVRTGR